ncbi:helix-turn-helix transcriptional regulator, partial [Agrobacterium vitis]|nr:helix-turn-helix transcriptional regulator [Allorhizobium ampelinum]
MDIATYIAELLSMKKWNQVKLAAH